MKQVLLFLMIVFLSAHSFGQEIYKSFLEEGKVWSYNFQSPNGNQTPPSSQEYYPEGTTWTEIRLDTLKYDSWYSKVGDEWVPNFETIKYYVKGEYTSKYGERFKCIYTSGPEWTDSLTLGIKEGELIRYNEKDEVMVTVFVRDYYESYIPCGEAMVYQFDWSVGQGLYSHDIFSSTTTSISQHYYYYGIIGEIKEGYFGGVRPLKYVDLDGKAPADKPGFPIFYEDTQGGRIIQGIGITEWNRGECLFGPSGPYEAATWDFYGRHYRSRLVHFERNGEVLYDVWPEKGKTDEIKSITNEKSPDATAVYDLYGRKMHQVPQRGIFIQNGRKVLR